MALYLLLVNLTLLFSFTMSSPYSFYKCGENTIKYHVVKAAFDRGCREYNGHNCHDMNCFKNKKLPEIKRNIELFPKFDGLSMVWPIVERKIFRNKEIGIVGIDISTTRCILIGVKYKLENKLIDCDHVIVNNLMSQQIELDRSSSGSLRQDRLRLGSYHGSANSGSLRHKVQRQGPFSGGSNFGSQIHYSQRQESFSDGSNSDSNRHDIQNLAPLLIDESSDNEHIDITESLRRESRRHGDGNVSPDNIESWFVSTRA